MRENHYKDIYRLNPNWNSTDKPQIIKIELELDGVDKKNIDIMRHNYGKLVQIANRYSREHVPELTTEGIEGVGYHIEIMLDHEQNSFTYASDMPDDIRFYLENYEMIKETIVLNNNIHSEKIDLLSDSFTLLSAFRNYNTYTTRTSLSNNNGESQLRMLMSQGKHKSVNHHDDGEPEIFSLIKVKFASIFVEYIMQENDLDRCHGLINNGDLLNKINNRLSVINIKCDFRLVDICSWSFEFVFYDIKHDKEIGDINSLSAGQKSILHLILEAYGRETVLMVG